MSVYNAVWQVSDIFFANFLFFAKSVVPPLVFLSKTETVRYCRPALHLVSLRLFCLFTVQVTLNKALLFVFLLAYFPFRAVVFICSFNFHSSIFSPHSCPSTAKLRCVKTLPECVRFSVSEDFTTLISGVQEVVIKTGTIWLNKQERNKV